LYGDPAPWSRQETTVFSILSFVNVTKYPVSLLYTLLTLGPVLMLLSALEKIKTGVLQPFAVIGRVPLFYYILHFFLIHAGAIVLYMIQTGKSLSEIDFHFNAGFGGIPPGYGYSLMWTYIVWITVVLVLYPVCAWYNRYKSTNHHWWLGYL
jgi:predicted acyltransferase